MDKVILGKTGLKVSKLCFGGLFVASMFNEIEQAKSTVKRAIELGVNMIDTAPGYGNSEEVLGKGIKGLDKGLIISTKLGGRPIPFNAQDKAGLKASIKESLRLLGRDMIDILIIHEPDRPGQYDWWTDWEGVNGPVLEFLQELKKDSIIKYIGLGGTTVYEMTHLVNSGKFDVLLTAFNCSLLWREAMYELIPAAKKQNMGIIVGSPLQQGALARKYEAVNDPKVHWLSSPRREQMKKLYAFSDKCGLSLPELSLRFVISNPDISCVLMGARTPEEVEQNVSAIEKGPLSSSILAELDEIAAMVPFRPFCEPFGIGHLLPKPLNYKGPGMA